MAAGNSLSPGTVCVQWIWGDLGDGGCDGGNHFAVGTGKRAEHAEGDGWDGLYPARTAFVLLGAPPVRDGEDGDGDSSGPTMTVSRVLASKVDGLRRRASQLKVRQLYRGLF